MTRVLTAINTAAKELLMCLEPLHNMSADADIKELPKEVLQKLADMSLDPARDKDLMDASRSLTTGTFQQQCEVLRALRILTVELATF